MNENLRMPPTITEAHPPLPLDEITELIKAFESECLERKKIIIDQLVSVHPTANFDWGSDWRYRRCRKLKTAKTPETVDELIWPKGVPAKIGRANPAGFQVMYLADRQDTAFQEARVIDDFTVVTDFGILEGRSCRVASIGELTQIQRTGRGTFAQDHSSYISNLINNCSRDEATSLLITDAFLRQCFVGHDDYEISSHVALSIFSKMPSLTAIAYPSRRQIGAVNFVVRVENFWNDWGIRSVRYGRATELAMGFYKVSGAQAVTGIHNDGRLDWEEIEDSNTTLELSPLFTPPETD